jgi:hypothetical protein
LLSGVQVVANSIARRTTIETCEEDEVDDGEIEEDNVGVVAGGGDTDDFLSRPTSTEDRRDVIS